MSKVKIFAVLLGLPLISFAHEMNFSIDQGEVIVVLSKMKNPYELTYKIPDECKNTKVEVSKSSSSIAAKHVGENCGKGATFTLKLNDHENVSVKLPAGSIKVENIQEVLSHVSKLTADVEAGTIFSKSKKLKVVRTHSYAGAKTKYKNLKNKKAPTLRLSVRAGAISL